jgi:hypothetical protein
MTRRQRLAMELEEVGCWDDYTPLPCHDNLMVAKRLRALRSRAARCRVRFDLDASDLWSIPSHCPILHLRLRRRSRDGKQHPDSLAVDRIIPAKGYTKRNCRWVSARGNSLKSNARPEELLALAADALRTIGTPCPRTRGR